MKTRILAVLKKLLTASVLLIGGLYLAACAFLYFQQENILFFPSPVDPAIASQYSGSAIEFSRDGTVLRGWFIESDNGDARTIIFYGGNGDELSRSLADISALGDFNYLMVNYRGYGDSEGMPGEAELKADAVAVLQSLQRQGRIDLARSHIIGRSLGSGIATHVAAQFDVASLILVTPYDSIAAVAAGRYPIFPTGLLLKHHFRSLDYVADIDEPTLIIKAERDRIVPHVHSDALIRAWQSPLQTVTLMGTTHNSIYSAAFYQNVRAFIEEHNEAHRADPVQ